MNMLSRINPSRDDLFFPLEQHFNKFFDEFFNRGSLSHVGKNSGFPKMNAHEENGEFVLTVCASGMTSDDVRVEVTPDNVLVLSGRMSDEYHSPENSKVYLRELRASAFQRTIQLPDHVDGDPTATMKDGMLVLKWKTKQAAEVVPKTKLISINTE